MVLENVTFTRNKKVGCEPTVKQNDCKLIINLRRRRSEQRKERLVAEGGGEGAHCGVSNCDSTERDLAQRVYIETD